MVAETGETIPMLLHTAKALQKARKLQQQAMLMWALEGRRAATTPDTTHTRFEQQLADPNDRDWRVLYRGSVLDD